MASESLGNYNKYMIVSGYTVIDSQIRNLNEGIKELRKLEWISPEPVLVEVVARAKETL